MSTVTVALKIVTPVHGGGVGWDDRDVTISHVRALDPVTPVRAASIRGQLRFWWRATTGCCLDSLEEMRGQEAELWGAASVPGRVALSIAELESLKPTTIRVFESRPSSGDSPRYNPRTVGREFPGRAYAAFALQPRGNLPKRAEDGSLTALAGVARLTLSCPEAHAVEVLLALDAWLLFGGVGGRTRRGFGAVVAKDRAPELEAFLSSLVQRRDELAGGKVARPRLQQTLPLVPSLHGVQFGLHTDSCSTPAEAHEVALDALRRFRQAPELGRNPPSQEAGNMKPAGRSRWPEPEAIRAVTGRASSRHAERHVKVDKFPRARFGMPILFHFQDQRSEPADSTLKPKDYERMASPLIVRPYHDGTAWRPLALVLSVPGADSVPVILQITKTESRSVAVDLAVDESRRVKPLGGATDALTAFLKYFTTHPTATPGAAR